MQSKAKTIKEYLAEVPDDRKEVLSKLHESIVNSMPKGFQEGMSYGMIGYVVPHSLYPDGYHCHPKQPLPFMYLASQKNYISFYHMGLYAGLLLEWFVKEWPKHSSKKIDMGKCCVRFKKPEDVPIKLIAELVTKMTPEEWISVYEKTMKKK